MQHHKSVCMFMLGLVLLMHGLAQANDDETKAQDLLAKVLKNRDAIQSGNITITTNWLRDSTWIVPSKSECKIIFDGDRIRAEQYSARADGTDASHYIGGFRCSPIPEAFFYMYMLAESLKESIPNDLLMLEDADMVQNERTQGNASKVFFPDPRYIGCARSVLPMSKKSVNDFYDLFSLQSKFPSSRLSEAQLEAIRKKRTLTVTEELYDNMICQKILRKSIADNGTSSFVIWVAPDQGYSIRKIDYDTVSTNPRKTEIRSLEKTLIEINVKQHQPSGIWFPSSWKLTSHDIDGLRTDLSATIDVISLNKPIDDRLLSLEDISLLRKGTPVSWHLNTPSPDEAGRILIWDGKNIVREGDYRTFEIENTAKSGRWRIYHFYQYRNLLRNCCH